MGCSLEPVSAELKRLQSMVARTAHHHELSRHNPKSKI
jgi:hypothetical protein